MTIRNIHQISDTANAWLSRTGSLPPDMEAEADADIARAKAELRERCDRTPKEGPVELPVYSLRDFGMGR